MKTKDLLLNTFTEFHELFLEFLIFKSDNSGRASQDCEHCSTGHRKEFWAPKFQSLPPFLQKNKQTKNCLVHFTYFIQQQQIQVCYLACTQCAAEIIFWLSDACRYKKHCVFQHMFATSPLYIFRCVPNVSTVWTFVFQSYPPPRCYFLFICILSKRKKEKPTLLLAS